MDDKDLVTVPVGAEGKVQVTVKGSKVILTISYDGKGLDGSIVIALDSEYFMDQLADAIPGKVDDSVFALIKAALKA